MINLSPSMLNLIEECPRCFWDRYNNRARPRGIFPSLPGGIDVVMKRYFDHFRKQLPPQIVGEVPGVLIDEDGVAGYTLKKLRFWRTGLHAYFKKNGIDICLRGAIDDCVVHNFHYAPLDYKTKASEPKPGESEKYYQNQMNGYNLLFKLNDIAIFKKPMSFLVYFWPTSVFLEPETSGFSPSLPIQFNSKVVTMDCNPDDCEDLIQKAADILVESRPDPDSGCEYCNYSEFYNNRTSG